MEKKKELTDNQKLFLDVLFEEAGGDPNVAKKLAGYSETSSTSAIVSALSEEIVERSFKYLAGSAPRAIQELLGIMNKPDQKGAMTKLKAVSEILNRAGVKERTGDINIKLPESGIAILPAKKFVEE